MTFATQSCERCRLGRWLWRWTHVPTLLLVQLPAVVFFVFMACDMALNETSAANVPGPKQGLVAYYPFSGNTRDASGNGCHCRPVKAVLTSDRSGRPRNAYSFNGTDAYIRCSKSPRLGLYQGVDMTVSVWIKPKSQPEEQLGIISKYEGFDPDRSEFFVSVANWGDRFVTEATAQGFDAILSTPPKLNKWSHIAVIYRGTESHASMYINGREVSSGLLTFNPQSTATNLLIGLLQGLSGYFNLFHGDIDDVRIYERALRAGEIMALFRIR